MIWLGNLARLVKIGHTQLHTVPKWLIPSAKLIGVLAA